MEEKMARIVNVKPFHYTLHYCDSRILLEKREELWRNSSDSNHESKDMWKVIWRKKRKL